MLMITVATMSHPGSDWSGGCHAVQTYASETAVLEAYCEDATYRAANWNAEDVRNALSESRAGQTDQGVVSAVIESDGGKPYTVYLAVTVCGSIDD